MYVSPNFKTKKALKEAVATRQIYEEAKNQPLTVGAVLESKLFINRIPPLVTVYSPGPFPCPENGRVTVEGPHYPEPHKWYAVVLVKDSRVIKVLS